MNFGEIFSRAGQLIWKHKILVAFGILAGLAPTAESGSGLRFDSHFDGPLPALIRPSGEISIVLILLLMALAVVLVIALVLLSALGRAALMRGAWLADEGAAGLSFSQLFQQGQRYFLRVLLLQVILFAAGLITLLILTIPSVLTFGLALLCLWPLYCLLVPFFFGLAVLSRLAAAGIIGEDLGVIDSLRRALALARDNLLQVIVMALALSLGSFVAGSIASIPLLAIVAPLALAATRSTSGSWIVLAAALLALYLPLVLAINGVITAYVESAWTLIFRRLSGRAAGSSLEHGALIY